MATLEDLDLKQTELIRKVQAAAIFYAPITASVPAAFTTGGVKEVQTIATTGTPTGGTFVLTFRGESTAPIVYNATASAIAAALNLLSNIGPGGVTATGGPLPTGVVVSFAEQFGDVPLLTGTGSFIGGTAPALTFTQGVQGTAIDLAPLPAAYTDIGLVTKDDAYTWARNVEMAETRSHGYLDPTRRDITGNVSSLAFTAQETKLKTLEVYHNVDLQGVTAAAATGEFTFNDPLQAATRYHRVISIGRDGVGTQAIYLIRVMPRAMLSEPGEQQWSDENELVYPMTMTATPDSALGYSMRYVFGGPGWRALCSSMGIPLA